MGAALEIIVVPALLIIAVIVLSLVAEFSVATTVGALAATALLGFGVTLLLRKEKEWEGPLEEHEVHEERAKSALEQQALRDAQQKAGDETAHRG